jgi:hypothetical protein
MTGSALQLGESALIVEGKKLGWIIWNVVAGRGR